MEAILLTNLNNQISITYQNGSYFLTDNPARWADSNIVVPYNKFFFVTDGEIDIRVNGTHYVVTENEWLLVPTGVVHAYSLTSTEFAKFCWMHFEFTINNKNLFQALTSPIKIKVDNATQIKNLFNKIFKASTSNTISSQLDIVSNINKLSSIFISKLPQSLFSTQEDLLDRIINYIANNYTESFSLSDLAKQTNFSVSQFAHKFKDRTGVSPIYFINLTRLEHAKCLLEQTSIPVREVMEKVGYFDSAYFSKIFKKYYHSSPLQYRRRVQQLLKDNKIK